MSPTLATAAVFPINVAPAKKTTRSVCTFPCLYASALTLVAARTCSPHFDTDSKLPEVEFCEEKDDDSGDVSPTGLPININSGQTVNITFDNGTNRIFAWNG